MGTACSRSVGGFFAISINRGEITHQAAGVDQDSWQNTTSPRTSITMEGGNPLISCVHIYIHQVPQGRQHPTTAERNFGESYKSTSCQCFWQWKIFGHTSTSFLLRHARLRISALSRRLSQDAGRQRCDVRLLGGCLWTPTLYDYVVQYCGV